MVSSDPAEHSVNGPRSRLFLVIIFAFVVVFVMAVLGLIAADIAYIDSRAVAAVLVSREIRAATWLSLWSSTLAMLISLLFAVPTGYAISRYRFPGRLLVDTVVDLPIVFPPLVMGLSLLVFFRTPVGLWLESIGLSVVYQRSGIVVAQFLVAGSFGIRAVRPQTYLDKLGQQIRCTSTSILVDSPGRGH